MAITQANRILHLSTPLGADVLLLSSFSGTETMSRLFSYQLKMLSAKDALEAKDIVGKNITWHIQFKDAEPRFFNGFVSRFAAGGVSPRHMRSYRAEVVPWLWFLTRTANCRIFQKKSAPEIIKTVFDDLGFSDYQLELHSSYPKREYCVQYRETAFNFVSRLMEEEGIFYFFRHDDGQHTLVLADRKTSYQDLPDKPDIDTWEHQFEFRSGKWARTDYNFETPSTNLLTNTDTLLDQPDATKYELFDYPGDYQVKGNGEAGTKVRMEEEEVPYEVVTGTSESYALTPGSKFALEGHDAGAEEGKYVVTSVQHSATDASFETGEGQSDYHNSFQCIPAAVMFRPTRLTPKPLIAGTQPAVVVGPKGEEIYTDKYGRVKVHFFWDRESESKRDENSSCWIRVAQVWAGKRWGASFWPRIGQEVVVDFLEGDPDRPIITGSVYNAEQMPPYLGDGLDGKHKSDNKVSGIKSNTTKEGKGFNEWRFDDTKGKEEIFIHAERNMDVRVKNESMERVISNRHLIVGWKSDGDDGDYQEGGDQRELVRQDKHLHINRHQVEQIEGNFQLTVGKGEADDGGNADVLD